MPIISTISDCYYVDVQFRASTSSADYIVGRPQLAVELPATQPQPNCGYEYEVRFLGLTAASELPDSEKLLSDYLVYDQETNQLQVMPTIDFSLIGRSISADFEAMLVQEEGPNGSLRFKYRQTIAYKTNGPEFVESIQPDQFSCNKDDENFAIKIPKVAYESLQTMSFRLDFKDDFSKLFEIVDRQIVFRDEYLELITAGKLCPPNPINEMTIIAHSNVLGETYYKFDVKKNMTALAAEETQLAAETNLSFSLEAALADATEDDFSMPSVAIDSIDSSGKLVLSFSDAFRIP